MKILIVVRSNVDWKNMTMSKFLQQSTHPISEKSRNRYARYIEAWNDKFQISLFEFRHRIQKLSEYTWGNMEGVTAIIKDMDWAQQIIENTDNCFVLPTDDDDWFHPKLISRIKNKKADNIRWKMAIHNAARPKLIVAKPGYHTNSYGFFKSAWDNLKPGQKSNTIRRHILSAGPLKTTKSIALEQCLSCWNRTLASMTMGKNEKQALEVMKRRAVNATKMKELPREANWIRPYVRHLIQLYKDML